LVDDDDVHGNSNNRTGVGSTLNKNNHHHPSIATTTRPTSCEKNPLLSPTPLPLSSTSPNATSGPTTGATPSKLSTFMGMYRRHHKSQSGCDTSVDGSSMGESNSLSSIFESIGYLSRRRRQQRKREHHSRGLTKGDGYGHGDDVLYRKRQEARMMNLRFSVLFLVLCCILAVITLSVF